MRSRQVPGRSPCRHQAQGQWHEHISSSSGSSRRQAVTKPLTQATDQKRGSGCMEQAGEENAELMSHAATCLFPSVSQVQGLGPRSRV